MTNFILFDNHIIVRHNNIIIDIIDIRTGDSKKSIGSKKNKFKLNNSMSEFSKSEKLIFNDWNELFEYYNIQNINKSGTHISYYIENKIRIKFYHINFRIEGLYEEFHQNEKVKLICNYIGNKLYGSYKEYDINGGLIVSANYHDNLLNGEYLEYRVGGVTINATYKDGKLDGIYHKIIRVNIYGNFNSYQYYFYSNGKKNGSFMIKYLNPWDKNMITNDFHTTYYLSGEYYDDILKFVNIYIRIDCELILIQKIYLDKYIFYTIETLYGNMKINKYIIEDKIYDYINNFKNIKTNL